MAKKEPTAAQNPQGEVRIEWLTWSFFRITSPQGKVILTNPWLSNPDSQTSLEQIEKADIILVPTGHRDEVGETVEIANKTGAKVVTTWEMAGGAFKGKIPDTQFVRTQPGSSVNLDGIKIRIVNAVHGSGGANALYGGPPPDRASTAAQELPRQRLTNSNGLWVGSAYAWVDPSCCVIKHAVSSSAPHTRGVNQTGISRMTARGRCCRLRFVGEGRSLA